LNPLINHKRIDNSIFDLSTTKLAFELIGKLLVRKVGRKYLVGKIVETEAYLDKNDLASHSAVGKTMRNEVMFGEAGLAYVYFTYGMHYCFNVVSGKKGKGSAVLIRAVEPIAGIDLMQKARGTNVVTNLTNGPAKLCQAFNIDKSTNGLDLRKSKSLYLADSLESKFSIERSQRIGIKKSKERLLRFFIKENKFVSKK
jgi:DNA-3-methyladenine glycosylase